MLPHLFYPLLNRHEWLLFGDVVYYESANWFTIVGRCDGFKSLLARRIPDLSLNSATCFQCHALGGELNANGWVFVFRQLILDVSAQQVGLPDSCVANENHYERKETKMQDQTKMEVTMSNHNLFNSPIIKIRAVKLCCFTTMIVKLTAELIYLRLNKKLKLSSCLVFIAILQSLLFSVVHCLNNDFLLGILSRAS